MLRDLLSRTNLIHIAWAQINKRFKPTPLLGSAYILTQGHTG